MFINVTLSLSKGNDVTTCTEEVSYGLLPRSWFYCPNLITVAPETRDRDLSKSCEYGVMTSFPSEEGYPIEPFEWGLPCCLNLMLLAFPWLAIYGFSNCSFFWHWAVQNW